MASIGATSCPTLNAWRGKKTSRKRLRPSGDRRQANGRASFTNYFGYSVVQFQLLTGGGQVPHSVGVCLRLPSLCLFLSLSYDSLSADGLLLSAISQAKHMLHTSCRHSLSSPISLSLARSLLHALFELALFQRFRTETFPWSPHCQTSWLRSNPRNAFRRSGVAVAWRKCWRLPQTRQTKHFKNNFKSFQNGAINYSK